MSWLKKLPISTNSIIARDFQELLATMTQFSRHLSTIIKITLQVLSVFFPTRYKPLELGFGGGNISMHLRIYSQNPQFTLLDMVKYST